MHNLYDYLHCLISYLNFIYREIKSRQDQNDLQKDLNLLETWGSTWGMRFNAAKCNIVRVSRKQTPIPYQYELSGQVLEEVKDAKYLGVTVSDDLEWTKHIDVITSKANFKLSFLRRNLKGCPEKLRETAYFSLVRSFLEYSATVWHPRQKYNSDKLEMVQRRAARFVKGRYGMFESVTQMLEQLTWIPLSKIRENSCLILFHKIINNLAAVPHSCLEKADVRTRKNHSQKFRHIGYNIDPYGQSFFSNCISAWNGFAKDIAETNTLDILKSKLQN